MKLHTMRIASLYILALVALAACRNTPDVPETKGPFCLTPGLKEKILIDTAIEQPAMKSIDLPGKVEVHPDKVVRFNSLLPGVVGRVEFTLGDYVRKGQVLAEITSTELSGLNAEVRATESMLRVAERELDVTRSLFDDGVASERDVLNKASEVERLEADLERLRETLAIYGGTGKAGTFRITAPGDGFIVEKHIVPGQQIQGEGELLFTLSDLREVVVTANLHTGNIKLVKEGMPVAISTTAYPGEVFTGKIDRLSNVFDPEERTLKARIYIDNTDLRLKPEMFVNVQVRHELPGKAVVVPAKAVIFDDNRYLLVVYRGDCDLEVRPVEPLAFNGKSTYIARGIEAGEAIIARNQLLIYNQLKHY